MASGDEYALFQVEAAPNGQNGTAAISTVKQYQPLQGISLKASPITDDRTDELRGSAQPIAPDITGWNGAEGTSTSRLYANLVGMYYTLLFGYVAPTGGGTAIDPGGGTVPTSAYMHQWDSASIDVSTVKTAQLTRFYGNSTGVVLKDTGVACSQLDIAAGDTGGPSTFQATLSSLYQARIADPAGTPAYDATSIKPFYRGQIAISAWLSSTATPINASLSFTNPFEAAASLTTASLWPATWDRPNTAGAVPRLTGEVDTKTIGTADYDAFVANTTFGYTIKWTSNQSIGTTAYPYSMWIKGAATYADFTPDDLLHNLRTGVSIPFAAGASGGTSAFVVTVVNGQSSYSSVS